LPSLSEYYSVSASIVAPNSSAQMNKRVAYNFLVADGPIPTSSLNGLSGVVEFEDVSSSGGGEDGPRLLVKVIDRNATCKFEEAST
jgi:hypothetical protein